MENLGNDNLGKSANNPLPVDKNPQDELEAILRQTGSGSVRKPGMVLPTGGGAKNKMLVPIIIGLAVVLLVATIYFLIWGIQFNQGTAIFYLNESEVSLSIDGQSLGAIDSGFETKVGVGNHTAKVSKDGFLELSENFEVVRGETKEITLELLPIPFIEKVLQGTGVAFARLNSDGSEVSFWDEKDRKFKSVDLEGGKISELFDGYATSGAVVDVSWSSVSQAALVQLREVKSIRNMFDNRDAKGAYIPLGERPSQGPANSSGIFTWLFDDAQSNASGWQPVLLTESVRENIFSADGGVVAYIYDPADAEYSLVRAKPDGDEWERVVIDLPKFNSPKLIWGPDDRYLFIEDNGTTYLTDLISGSITNLLPDRIYDMPLAFSPDGDKLAYVSQEAETGVKRIKVYDIVGEKILEPAGLDGVDPSGAQFVWTGNDTLLVALANQIFREFDIVDGSERLIPFVGQDIDFQIVALEYSRLGRILLLKTTTGLFKMKV